MHSREYTAIANLIANQYLQYDPETKQAERVAINRIARALSYEFLRMNPKFKPDLFLSKCCFTGRE